MRRAGLTQEQTLEQTQLIQTTVGTETTVEKVEKALYLTCGQNHKVSSPAKFNNMRGRWKSDRAHFADDEVYYENEDEYNDGEYPAHDDDGMNGMMQSTYYGSTAADDMPSSDAKTLRSSIGSTHADSKRQLNQLRVSRGFFPVVALTDGGQRLQVNASASGSQSPSRSGSSKGKSKGKGKGKKGSKGSKGSSSTKKGMSSVRERGEHMSSTMCLRCGMFGHMAANCPTKIFGNSPGKKRPADASDSMQNFVGMAQHLISDANSWVTNGPDACIHAGGASTFLAGSEYVLRYLKWLELIGMDVEHLQLKRCDKSTKFGGDGGSVSRWMVQLPAKLGDKVGRIQCFVIFGATSSHPGNAQCRG